MDVSIIATRKPALGLNAMASINFLLLVTSDSVNYKDRFRFFQAFITVLFTKDGAQVPFSRSIRLPVDILNAECSIIFCCKRYNGRPFSCYCFTFFSKHFVY